MFSISIGDAFRSFSSGVKKYARNAPACVYRGAQIPPMKQYGAPMIDLTRLNGHRLAVNCDLIKFAEAAPDTTLALVTGEKIVVLESLDELADRILMYRAKVFAAAWPAGASAVSGKSAQASVQFAVPNGHEDE